MTSTSDIVRSSSLRPEEIADGVTPQSAAAFVTEPCSATAMR